MFWITTVIDTRRMIYETNNRYPIKKLNIKFGSFLVRTHDARKKAHKGTAFFWIVQIKYVKNVFYLFIVCVCAFFLLLLQTEYKLG